MNQSTINEKNKQMDTRRLVLLSILSAIAYLCVFIFRIPVVSFLKYEPKDVIITIGAFLYGPVQGILMSVAVSILEMVTISDTGPIGMIMNIISTCAFSTAAAVIYKKKRTLSGAVIGLIVGSLLMTAFMLLWNYLITPWYMGTPRDVVADMLLPVFLPFNLLKAGLNSAITLLLYKPIATILKKSGLAPTRQQQTETKTSKNILLILVSAFILITCIIIILMLNGIL